jgi:starch synthase
VKYNVKNVAEKKIHNKRALQAELGLEVNDDRFLIGIVSRLTDQKGFDLIAYMMEKMCQQGIQFDVLGTGDGKYEDMSDEEFYKALKDIFDKYLNDEDE